LQLNPSLGLGKALSLLLRLELRPDCFLLATLSCCKETPVNEFDLFDRAIRLVASRPTIVSGNSDMIELIKANPRVCWCH
jgi:hypothetical protein